MTLHKGQKRSNVTKVRFLEGVFLGWMDRKTWLVFPRETHLTDWNSSPSVCEGGSQSKKDWMGPGGGMVVLVLDSHVDNGGSRPETSGLKIMPRHMWAGAQNPKRKKWEECFVAWLSLLGADFSCSLCLWRTHTLYAKIFFRKSLDILYHWMVYFPLRLLRKHAPLLWCGRGLKWNFP